MTMVLLLQQRAYFLLQLWLFIAVSRLITAKNACINAKYQPNILEDPCSDSMNKTRAPDAFSITFQTQYGDFTADCLRQRAPIWTDRVWNMARLGYYNDNYFFRVIPNRYVQFGTNGDPEISNIYNWSSTTNPECAILRPQPPDMPYCMAHSESEPDQNCSQVPGLSNTFGTLSMSTSFLQSNDYPNGVTWNATAELFINIGNNTNLDPYLFVPICTISPRDMNQVVLEFPNFGEVAELGGSGPSLGLLYQDGNAYIESNTTWKRSMAQTTRVNVCDKDGNHSVGVARVRAVLFLRVLEWIAWL